jgi:Protein of unknown function, DUF481
MPLVTLFSLRFRVESPQLTSLRRAVILLLAWLAALPVHADMLVYPDGNRLTGRFLRHEGDVLVFQSERFGEVRVKASEAKLTPTPPVNAAASAPAPKPAPQPKRAPESKPATGTWHGRLAFSVEDYNDSRSRSRLVLDGRLNRKWAHDSLNLAARYEFNKTDQVVNTDLFKSSGSWRHLLSPRYFTVYSPSMEWNRSFYVRRVPNDYMRLQQEVGVGWNVFEKPKQAVRAGMAENLFTYRNLSGDKTTFYRAESLFAEADIKLVDRISITERVIYYHSFESGGDGMENQAEISKKLTDSISLSLRYEYRKEIGRQDPRQGVVADYSLARLLLGFDF